MNNKYLNLNHINTLNHYSISVKYSWFGLISYNSKTNGYLLRDMMLLIKQTSKQPTKQENVLKFHFLNVKSK